MSTTDTRPWGVKGLTDNPRAPIVAKAKIGKKAEKRLDNGRTVEYPTRLDYIVFVEPKTGREIPEFAEVFGEKPTSFKALLAGDTLEQNIDVAWKCYSTKGLKCRGDGEIGIDRETGEQRHCAGEYNFDDQTKHLCPQSRPGKKNGKDTPPECKPVLSMRLVVPQIPGLGLVQLDTGGVASSIQTLVWQLRMIERMTGGHMAGIAVRVGIRAFPDRFGNAAYAWQLEPLKGDDAQELRSSVEPFVRLESQLPQALPELEEAIDPDVYGLPAPEDTEASDEDEKQEVHDAIPGIPGEWLVPVSEAEDALYAALDAAGLPEAKAESLRRKVAKAYEHAEAGDLWQDYIDWICSERERLEAYAQEGSGQGALV